MATLSFDASQRWAYAIARYQLDRPSRRECPQSITDPSAPVPRRNIRRDVRAGVYGLWEATLTYVGARARLDQPTGAQMSKARLAQASDLEQLLDLFRVSEVSSIAQPPDRARRIWSETLTCKGVAVFVSDPSGQIVATCMLITVPNLLRGGRGHGFLENVVTHPEFRGQGHGRAVVQAALTEAWSRDCYHVLLQTGRRDSRIHRFYEGCGFKPGVRAAYVASRPV
jgi:GNAT superfamily N-acetyltransferase